MTVKHILMLILLAAVWGASFLLMRVSVPEFGAVPMMFVRVLVAGLLLLPVVFIKRQQTQMQEKAKILTIIGFFNSALPFSLIAYSTLYVTAGFASVLNAATPMFAALIAFIWLGQRLTRSAVWGLTIGFAGVLVLVWDKIGIANPQGGGDSTLAILAGLGGAFSYGIAANSSKRYLAGVSPMVSTVVSQLGAAAILLPIAIWQWPSTFPSWSAWTNVIILAVVCTGLAQIVYFKLIEETSAANATTVTFLIPIFGLVWGAVFLNELVPMSTLLACVIILLGVSLTIGVFRIRQISQFFKSKLDAGNHQEKR